MKHHERGGDVWLVHSAVRDNCGRTTVREGGSRQQYQPSAYLAGSAGCGVHDEGDNETIKTQNFGENEDEDHADVETGLLRNTANTRVTDNADGKACRKTYINRRQLYSMSIADKN